ncbi:hypothetical protein FACS1894145_0720 [Bacteroidia bacterium]|nr:hypothetical protein FACS1894145_0720 [Bacteroidia bacterium]
MMKRSGLVFLLLSLFSLSYTVVSAQISHGGKPFFLQNSLLRSSTRLGPLKGAFEMPAFKLDSVLQEDRLDEGNRQRSYRFAHKFFTKIEKRKDAALTVLPDGTKVWQIQIRSQGAYSINVLLTDFELPPGGKLFVYNENHSCIIGSFDYRNNSPRKILPLQPVAGESIIIEYSEPAGVPFEGNFTVSEVNHDYRDVLRKEPGNDVQGDFLCMPDVLCSEADKDLIRSTVLLIIDGTVGCSGVLVNNTENDGRPYLLTAVHCLNNDFEDGYHNMDYYMAHAGTIVTFFNYNRPVCNTELKGTEEMTMAEAYPRVILEKKDVALLELRDKPPGYYNAYYAGWNMNEEGNKGVHVNLHHPHLSVKKYGKAEADLPVISLHIGNVQFDSNSHWQVPGWTTGSTSVGSSGSPLFDKNGLVVGTLSAGSSLCSGNFPDRAADQFAILYKSWETADPNNQLKTYLDPNNKGLKQQTGMDPNEENPLVRLSNINFSAGDVLTVSTLESPNSGYVYGSSNLKTTEFAEEFTTDTTVEVVGVYLLVPPLSSGSLSGVEISIYSGETFPEKLLQVQDFSPKYLDYSETGGFNPKDKNRMNYGTENFVLFDEPVKIDKGKFFVSFRINGATSFCVYNATFAGAAKQNTAWVKDPSQGWIQAVAYSPAQAVKTSLAIQPLVRGAKIDSLPVIPDGKDDPVFFDSKSHTLSLWELVNEPVPVNVYSLTGALMEKTQFNRGQKSISLAERPKGTIGIVQLFLVNKTYSKKIIY